MVKNIILKAVKTSSIKSKEAAEHIELKLLKTIFTLSEIYLRKIFKYKRKNLSSIVKI